MKMSKEPVALKFMKREKNVLKDFALEVSAWWSVFGEAVAAVDWSSFCGLEWYFCFFAAVCAGRFVHFSWSVVEAAAAASAAEISVSHVLFTPTRVVHECFFLPGLAGLGWEEPGLFKNVLPLGAASWRPGRFFYWWWKRKWRVTIPCS